MAAGLMEPNAAHAQPHGATALSASVQAASGGASPPEAALRPSLAVAVAFRPAQLVEQLTSSDADAQQSALERVEALCAGRSDAPEDAATCSALVNAGAVTALLRVGAVTPLLRIATAAEAAGPRGAFVDPRTPPALAAAGAMAARRAAAAALRALSSLTDAFPPARQKLAAVGGLQLLAACLRGPARPTPLVEGAARVLCHVARDASLHRACGDVEGLLAELVALLSAASPVTVLSCAKILGSLAAFGRNRDAMCAAGAVPALRALMHAPEAAPEARAAAAEALRQLEPQDETSAATAAVAHLLQLNAAPPHAMSAATVAVAGAEASPLAASPDAPLPPHTPRALSPSGAAGDFPGFVTPPQQVISLLSPYVDSGSGGSAHQADVHAVMLLLTLNADMVKLQHDMCERLTSLHADVAGLQRELAAVRVGTESLVAARSAEQSERAAEQPCAVRAADEQTSSPSADTPAPARFADQPVLNEQLPACTAAEQTRQPPQQTSMARAAELLALGLAAEHAPLQAEQRTSMATALMRPIAFRSAATPRVALAACAGVAVVAVAAAAAIHRARRV